MPNETIPSGFLLYEVARLLRRNFSRRIQVLGLTQAQCRTLLYLSRHEGVRQIDLAEALEIQPITLARLIDQLAEARMVERRNCPDDRRAFRLVLTPSARPVMTKIRALVEKTWADAIGDVGEARMSQLFKTLQDLKTNLLAAEPAGKEERHVA